MEGTDRRDQLGVGACLGRDRAAADRGAVDPQPDLGVIWSVIANANIAFANREHQTPLAFVLAPLSLDGIHDGDQRDER